MKNATHSHPTDARQALRALLVEAGNTLQAVYEECPWPGPSTPEHTQRWNAAYSHHKEVREAYSALVKSLYYPRPDPPQRFDYAAILLQGERLLRFAPPQIVDRRTQGLSRIQVVRQSAQHRAARAGGILWFSQPEVGLNLQPEPNPTAMSVVLIAGSTLLRYHCEISLRGAVYGLPHFAKGAETRVWNQLTLLQLRHPDCDAAFFGPLASRSQG